MGGWVALRLAQMMPERVAGLVGIAVAPDFTERSLWAGMGPAEREELEATGRLERPSPYSEEPYIFTNKLIETGRDNLVLDKALPLPFPVRLFYGTADDAVPIATQMDLLAVAQCSDLTLTLVHNADHRLSEPTDLARMVGAVNELANLAT